MRSVIRTRDLVVIGLGLAAIAAITLLLRVLPNVSPTTVALSLLLVVLATATVGRLRTAIIVSFVAMLTFNYFFLPPVGTFTIADPQNWIALGAFLVVAIIASHFSAAAQERTRDAVARRNEVTRLFDLTRDVLLTTDTAGAIEAVARHVARRFDLERIAVCLPTDTEWRILQGGNQAVAVDAGILDASLAKAKGRLEFDARQRAYGGHMRAGTHDDLTIVPLRHGTKAVGLLVAGSNALDAGALDALAGIVAIAIERAAFLADRDAAELNRQKADLAGTLLASLSHDLRTPLTAIKVAVENLRGELPPAERRAQSEAAAAEVDRLARVVQSILDMARVDAGAMPVRRQWVAPSDVVDAAVAHVQHELARHSLSIDADDVREVEIDPRLTSVALSHLLENAAHYSPAGSAIEVRARVESEGLIIVVRDHGPGLDAAELEHLFDRFYRGRAARDTTSGTGMGLAITRGLLAAAGGRVWAENASDGGAQFTVVVPAAVRATALTE